MGKSNRIRNGRANVTLSGVKPTKKNKGMPSWALNLITIAVAAVILISVVVSLLSANGVFGRMQTAMKTDNYRVNTNMMKYFFQTQYQNLSSQLGSDLSSYGIDTSKSLKEQDYPYGEGITWFDYFMDMTEVQVKTYLIYCEEADVLGIELDKDDKDAISEELDMIDTYASMYGYTANSYIANMYGKGVSKGDVRDCLEMVALYEKCSAEIGDGIIKDISDDDIKAEYDANSKDYDLVNTVSHTFTVTYEEAKKALADGATEEEILAKYNEMISDAKDKANALAAVTDLEAFKDAIAKYIIAKNYDDNYDDDLKASNVTDENQVKDTAKDTVRTKVTEYIFSIIDSEGEFSADAVVTDKKVFGEVEVHDTYASFIKDFAKSVYDDSVKAIEKTVEDDVTYNDSDEAIEWAFEDARKSGDIKTFQNGDGADSDAAVTGAASELKSFSAEVVYLVDARHKKEGVSKNVAIMTFASTEKAKEALAKLSEGMSLEEFEAIAEELEANYEEPAENYTKGAMGSDAFDEWLYGDGVKIGSVTAEVINISETTFGVALYYADGMEEWKVTVRDAIYSEEATAYDKELQTKFEKSFKVYGTETVDDEEVDIIVNPKCLTKIDA